MADTTELLNDLSELQNLRNKSESEINFAEYASSRILLSPTSRPFLSQDKSGNVVYSLHAGQRIVIDSTKRIIAAIAGRQSGKSAVGVPWLHKEMKTCGPGLYMVVAPSYPLLADSAIPKIEELFTGYYKYGKVRQNPLRFIFSPEGERRMFQNTPFAGQRILIPTTIRFGHAANPESLEAKTALAAWLDEAGQDGFKLNSWEAIQGRLTTTMGRILISTTPYNLGWLKSRVVDPWQKCRDNDTEHKDIDVITWRSIESPAFSEAEYYRLRETMPLWKWNMFYNGVFDVPAGLIYGIMKELEAELKVKRIDIPVGGPKYGGLDFGGPNTFGLMATRDPKSDKVYVYREYFPGVTLPIKTHVSNILVNDKYFDRFVGGAKSEVSFREEFFSNGLRVDEPSISDVQGGIDRVYGLMAQKKLYVCEDLSVFWEQLYTYQYETDPDTGDLLPELKIKSKSSYHAMDALRYLCSLFGLTSGPNVAVSGGQRPNIDKFRQDSLNQIGLRVIEKSSAKPGARMARASVRPGMTTARGRRGIRLDLLDDY